MRLTFLTGIWPPDIGGPATHGPEFARFLVSRGHEVVVVTMGDGEPTVQPCEVVVVAAVATFSRSLLAASLWSLQEGRDARTCSTRPPPTPPPQQHPSRLAARSPSSSSPTRLTRGRSRYGLFDGSLEEFQLPGGRRVESLKAARTRALRRARAIVVPSAYLARIAAAWGLDERQDHGAPQPRPGDRIDHDADCTGGVRVRRPADAAKGPRHRDRRRRPGAEGTAHDRRRRPRPGAARGSGSREPRPRAHHLPSERSRVPRPSPFSREPTPA